MVMGTIEYMSPEQVKGETVDGRSDQFALAAVAYRLLSGATLFGQHSLATLAYKIVNEAPPTVRMRNAGLPFAVDAVVSRALSKSPENRFPSCTEFVDALAGALALPRREESQLTMPLPARIPGELAQQIATAATIAAEKSPAKKSRRPALAVATAVVLCGGSLVIWRPWEKPAAPPTVPEQTTDTPPPRKAVAQPNSPQLSVKPAKPDVSVPATIAAVANKPQPVPAKEPPAVAQPDETSADMENTPAEPTPPQTPHPAIDAHKRGLELLKTNQARAAVGAFAKAIAIRPEWPRPYLNRGRAYQKQGDYDAAIRDYSQVLQMQPNNAYAHALRGTAYLRLKNDDRAAEDFNSALALNPDQSMALYGRGMVRLNRAAIRLALDDFNAAIRKSPNYVAAYTARGNVRRKLGDHAGADADFKIARELSGH
jgi:Tfp pilus assembly protein PilF